MKIRFAIIGCGYIGKRHALHIRQHPEAELVAAYDVVAAQTQALCADYGGKACASPEEFWAIPADLVCVCTPNGSHHEMSIAALQHHRPVLVEKPMSIKKEWCEAMLQTALRQGCPLFVVKQNRFNPPVQAVKQLLETHKLGAIYSVSLNCYWNRNAEYYRRSPWKGTLAQDGGTLFTQFSHFIDVLYYLLGDIEPLTGKTANVAHQSLIEFEDTGHFIFRLKQHPPALGTLHYTTAAYRQNMEGSMTIFAENATIKIGGKYLNTIDYQCTAGFDIEGLPPSNAANAYGYYEGSMSNHDKIIENVIQTLKGKEQIMTNAYDGLKVVEIIENFYKVAVP